MGALDQLMGIAQIAATYSGFIAIFLAYTKEGRFGADDGHFVQAMVLGTIGTLVMALTPQALSLLMPEARMWFVVTVFALVAGIPSAIYQGWQQLRMPGEEARAIPVGWHLPGWALGFCALGAFIAALEFVDRRAGFYVLGVIFSLAVSVWCFIAIVFRKFF